jgi:hypothetical protein
VSLHECNYGVCTGYQQDSKGARIVHKEHEKKDKTKTSKWETDTGKDDSWSVSTRSYKDPQERKVFDEINLNGFYRLDLAHPYERYVAEILAHEGISNKGECWRGECIDGKEFDLDENMDLDQLGEFLPPEGTLELTYRSEKIGDKKVLSHSLSDCIISAFCLRQHETACAHLGCQNDTAVISRKVIILFYQTATTTIS